jgi:aminopeptidase N
MVHGLTHAWLETETHAPPAWIDEGAASFMGSLWLEKTRGRTKALESLDADRQALALAEPSSPGESAGQPLAQATSPVYYRTKAAYVFWMLRDLAGDGALAAALRDYDSTKAAGARDGASAELEKLIEQHAGRDLSWFFADWVDADKGLPDLAIDSVFPTLAQAGNTLVAVNLSNSGYASAEIPVTVQTDNNSVTQRILVPARGKADRRILIQGPPTEVQANDGAVPETEASVHVKMLTDAVTPMPAPAQPSSQPQ